MAKLPVAQVGQLRDPVGKQALLDALFLDFKDIARTARSIALDEPGFAAAPFRFPADYSEKTCTTHADALLTLLEDNAAPVADGGDTPAEKAAKAALRAKFVAFALPADFVEDLREDRDAIDERNTDKHHDNFQGVLSTKEIDVVLGQIQSVVTRLDAVMQNPFRRAPEKLRAWQSASHIERAPVREAKEKDPKKPADSPLTPPA
ncbi:MAG: hypothetical protein QE267_09955 [Akkermansiaceae bacterium]|nr:hypothetical protein [Akkermansiaceae bacterium]